MAAASRASATRQTIQAPADYLIAVWSILTAMVTGKRPASADIQRRIQDGHGGPSRC